MVRASVFLSFFWLFSDKKSQKHLKSTKKLENCQKSALARVQVHAAPKSWSKYTTVILTN